MSNRFSLYVILCVCLFANTLVRLLPIQYIEMQTHSHSQQRSCHICLRGYMGCLKINSHTHSFENWSSTQMSASSSSGHIALESHLEVDLIRDDIYRLVLLLSNFVTNTRGQLWIESQPCLVGGHRA